MASVDQDVRVIETAAPPARFARGWHCLGLLDEFRDCKPLAVHAFGTKLVVFSDRAGSVHVLNAYCPHMGGDLSQGSIKDDNVACPFHDWRWSGSGRCMSIPYARRVPVRARTKAWETRERNGMLFVWHDPQGNPPPPELEIPTIEGVGNEEWTTWTWNRLTIEGSHSREIVDNVVDMAHFFYVHFSFPTYFRNVFEGHTATQYMENRGRPDVARPGGGSGYTTGRGEATYFGPSYMIDWMWKDQADGKQTEIVLVNCHYPVTSTSFDLQYGVIVKKPEGMSDDEAQAVAEKYAAGVEQGFRQDVVIWQNKTKIDNPLLCEEDGPVYQLRRWYEQFYVDVEDVTPEMTDRFEFEIDTTQANLYWEQEVEANLERQAEAIVAASPAADEGAVR